MSDNYYPETWSPNFIHSKESYYESVSEMVCPPKGVRLPGFKVFDHMTGGLRPYEFSILCGATGTGKTTLCANLSLQMMVQDIPQFVASVETGHSDYLKRMISAKAERDWNSGEAVPLEKLKIFQAQSGDMFLKNNLWLSLYDNRTSVENLMADISYAVDKHGVKVAIIDNLNFFMEITSAQNAVIEMDRVIHEMIIFCKQVPVHVIMVMHPKKTDGGRVESEFDIKGSSTAVQEAHNVFLWNRPHPELIKAGTATPDDRELKICKVRKKGKFVGRRIVFNSIEGVKYYEGNTV